MLAAASGTATAVADLANALFLSAGTIRNYLSSAMRKLGARSRIEAVDVAAEKGHGSEPDVLPTDIYSRSRPSCVARSIAALRLETPSLRYTEIACVFTVLRETKNWAPISRNDRWVASNGRSRSSAPVSRPDRTPVLVGRDVARDGVDLLAEHAEVRMTAQDFAGVADRDPGTVEVAEREPGAAEASMLVCTASQGSAFAGCLVSGSGARRAAAAETRQAANALPWLAVQTSIELAAPGSRSATSTGPGSRSATPAKSSAVILDLGVLGEEVDVVSRHVAADGPGVRPGRLTGAELRLLPLLATHLSFREIGAQFFVSRSTVKTQAISVYRKLGVSSRSAAIERATQLGLLRE